jgi:uncharacterized membrane protein
MFAHYLFSLTFTATIGCGIVAGVFFAFSTFVMPALARLQPDRGIVAMQSIGITAINPLFMLALFRFMSVRSNISRSLFKFQDCFWMLLSATVVDKTIETFTAPSWINFSIKAFRCCIDGRTPFKI